MVEPDGLTPDEQRTADLVDRLRETGNLHPLLDALRGGQAGPERARATRCSCSASSISSCSCRSRWTR